MLVSLRLLFSSSLLHLFFVFKKLDLVSSEVEMPFLPSAQLGRDIAVFSQYIPGLTLAGLFEPVTQ